MNKKRIMKWIGLAVMLSMAPFVRATVDNNNPIANSKAVVIWQCTLHSTDSRNDSYRI